MPISFTRRVVSTEARPHKPTQPIGTASPAPMTARPGLYGHAIGEHSELTDDAGEFLSAYGIAAGDQVLVRPDG